MLCDYGGPQSYKIGRGILPSQTLKVRTLEAPIYAFSTSKVINKSTLEC